MNYIGENLLPGQFGHFFIILSLVASLLASFAYFKATGPVLDENRTYWRRLARISFTIECISVFAIFGIIFYIVSNHLYEYKYAWQHSSKSLEYKYLLAGIWEGQEGSFLLWSIWHCVLGLILMRTAGKWEAPVMTVVSFAQFCLATMITGVYFLNWKMGSNPFILLRESGIYDNAPAMHINFDVNLPVRPDYLSTIRDGNDLNPLLQNYWMVIHPPVLFLGFASTLVPFAFAIAGLWTRQFGDWIKMALPWSLFSLAALGVGIMMGAAWAYESLTFGGYWAWDPVENASLVPWLILAAGIHTLLIYKHTGQSLRATFVFLILQFFFILYSTFLTRSGILGESSVHAFTDLGMNAQLYLLLFVFAWPFVVLTAARPAMKMKMGITALALLTLTWLSGEFGWAIGGLHLAPMLAFGTILAGVIALIGVIQKNVPALHKEEATSSREFWMFIGSLIFFLSAMVIIFKTSLPVINKVFDMKKAAPQDEEFAYNQIQVFVAIIIGLLTAITQYLKYSNTSAKFFWKKIALPTILSAIAATLILAFGNVNYDKHGLGFLGAIWLAIVCAVYAIVANAGYIWIGLKGKLSLSGGSIAHFGFGLVLLGILISSSKKEILSHNTSGIHIPFGEGSEEKTGENLTLVKGMTMRMGKYDVTYTGDSAHPRKQQWYYKIHFKSREGDEEFTLKPNAFVNYKGNEGLMANPDSRHYLTHDVFTYVSSLPNPDKNKDTASFAPFDRKLGDTIFYSRGFITLERVATRDSLPFEGFSPADSATVVTLKVQSMNNTSYTSEPLLINRNGVQLSLPDTVMAESLILRVNKMTTGGGVEIGLKESDALLQYVTLKAYKFPMIKVLWLGIIITAIGILMSMVQRIKAIRAGRAK